MSRRDRHSRHLAAARHFERLGDEELAGALAAHDLAAYETAADGAEKEAAAAQARLALRGAADRAAALGAFDPAVEYLRQAIAITDEPAERAGLQLEAARFASSGGVYADARSFAERAEGDYRAAGDVAGAARATAELGSIALYAG